MMTTKNGLLLAFTIVLFGQGPAQAEYLSYAKLREDLPWTLSVFTAGPNLDRATAVTVYYLGRALDVEAILTVPYNTILQQEFPKPARVKRIVIEADPAMCNVADIEIFQPGQTANIRSFVLGSICGNNNGHVTNGRLVIDVAPAP